MPHSHGFVHRPSFHRPQTVKGNPSSFTTTKLEALSESLDPTIEAELCTTMAHVALDFTGLVSPSRSIVRLLSVVGRLFAISADYLPDHSIHTEELMIQVFLLSLALRELFSDRLGKSSPGDGRA